jgi:hypothetical protein
LYSADNGTVSAGGSSSAACRARQGIEVNHYRLYGTSACHLCELAEEMLEALRKQGLTLAYDKVDISESDDLFERYGLVIPVLQGPRGEELRWPFSGEELRQFIAAD